MRSTPLLAACLLLALLPARAGARQVAPPGNSGVNQYLEDVPAAGGNRPTPSVSASGSRGGGPLRRSLSRLAQLGKRGSRAAAVAASGIPQAAKAPPAQPGGGAATALVHAAGGSGIGMGVLLPLILVAAAGATAFAFVLRRRRA
jgi:hypothetical protein